jgi:hypothetical protein
MLWERNDTVFTWRSADGETILLSFTQGMNILMILVLSELHCVCTTSSLQSLTLCICFSSFDYCVCCAFLAFEMAATESQKRNNKLSSEKEKKALRLKKI